MQRTTNRAILTTLGKKRTKRKRKWKKAIPTKPL